MTTAMGDPPNDPVAALDESWFDRREAWARKLGRLKLGVEPIEAQLARYRRVTWGVSAVAGAIGLMFVALFTAFGRPDVGLVLAAVLMLPVIALAWIDHIRLERRARGYERDSDVYQAERRRLLEASSVRTTNDPPRSAG